MQCQLQKKKFQDESQLQKKRSHKNNSVCISFINEFGGCEHTYLYVNDLPKQSVNSQDCINCV